MRKIPASLAVLGLVAVGLVGCSLPGSNACARADAADPAALDAVTVTGSTDDAPDVELYTPFHVTSPAFEDLVVGDGTQITTDTQLIVMDISITSGETGENLVETDYDGDLSRVSPVSRWFEVVPGFEDVLQCATEGSRIVVALPPGGIEAQTAESLEMGEDDSAVAVIDIRKVYLPKADGANQYNVDRGLPSIVRAPDGRPGVIIPDAEPPTDLVVQTIKKGTGPVVTADAPVRVHYTGVTWADRTVFDTTWDAEPKSIELDTMLPGFAEAITGQAVGSQVLIVIPPDQAYGDQAQGPIPADSTLVFVVDILGIDQPVAASDAG
ncbi:peptidylprolyl isomerase [Microbacterium sp. cf046]|uniref:FKBP-type peptidyl-prolyl cis-trans isomerase n=1 Tax=Microbacterium sp. cf046 TaxID=1761803 RepID=UPI0008EDDBE6|nr:FKBP-type peptidyl-prolyl cis-trans isomerase [Microbacterium sp. cf046]SFS04453.1 peptidylprolyl isomerase [Microbacterium sp. cf046]